MLRKVNGSSLTEATLGQYIPRGQENIAQIRADVEKILGEVRLKGDAAIKSYTSKFDGINAETLPLKVSDSEFETAEQQVPRELVEALKAAKGNIEKFHKAQIREEWAIETMPGVKTGQIMRPICSVGLYAPGGKAVYPSSVLMEAVPAKVAGVEKLVLCSPPQKNGAVSPAILVAARLCGVDAVFRCGGAQAIAGMAYGTESISKVQKIFGPGNKWVAAAKKLVSEYCAIDNPAGPSEILLIVDDTTNPVWAAYDLIAQAEHGVDNVALLLSQSKKAIEKILTELEKAVAQSPRKQILQENLQKVGLAIEVDSPQEILRLINEIAPEHLHLNCAEPRKLIPQIQNAGAIFIGPTSPVPLGDYCAGTNHVLPTGGYAKTYSGLSTFDFMKTIDTLEVSLEGVKKLYPILSPIAEYEGLVGHRDAVFIRTQDLKKKEAKKNG